MKLHMLLAIFALALLLADGQKLLFAAAAPGKKPESKSWIFGQSSDRRNPLWREDNDTDALVEKTRPKASSAKTGAVDTSGGISNALDQVVKTKLAQERKQLVEGQKPQSRGSVGMSMANESSSWKVAPGEIKIDEYMPRDRKHVVRAFADVKAGDALDIKVGPELHLRDERVGAEGAHEKQPESSLGVGMHFKLDF